jgi:hypothetical protein
MKRGQRLALLTLLTREMRKRDSWCGETHIQKATFLLQELLGVDAGFDFILYRHGPFSFDLRDELSSMQADDLLELCVRQQGYGPTYAPTRFSEEFLERFPKTVSRYSQRIEFIADELNSKGVAELERIATSFFIMNREGINDAEERAGRLIELKPHITEAQAREASFYVNGLINRYAQRFPMEAPAAYDE